MRLIPLALALAAGALAPTAGAAAPPGRLAELPGVRALPPTPPLAPPQPPLVETPRLRGTVTALERVLVGIDASGTPNRMRVSQRLTIRALGDYTFQIPAPVISVRAEPGSESQPGRRPNQILWSGFSPRRKVLAALAELRLEDTVDVLPLRIRISGAPVRPGPFRLEISIENATRTRAGAFTAAADDREVADAFAALRAAAALQRPVEGRTLRIRGESRPASVEAWAPFELRGSVTFPPAAVRGLRPARFARRLGREPLRVTLAGVADRTAAPTLRLTATPSTAAAIPGSARTLDDLIAASVRYARTLQYRSFLANPDPIGPTTTTYVYETAVAVPSAAEPRRQSDDGSDVPAALLAAALALLGLGLVVLWAHS